MNIKNKINQELNLKFDILPRHIRYWVSYLHDITGVAVEIIVVTLLAFLGLACQDLYCVQLENKQRFPLALYLLLLSRSGSGKSRIFRLLKEPVAQLEREFEDAYRAEFEMYGRNIILWGAEFKVLNKLYKKDLSQGGDTTKTAKKLEECIGRKPKEPVRKVIILTNPTSEALAKAIGLGYQNKALFNDEAIAVYKGGLVNNPALLNTYWCADKVTIDRASSESFVIENYVFSSYLMMQPQPYDNISRQKRANIRDTGLQARTLMVDMEQITEPCIINGHYTHGESVLRELYSVITQHMKAGVKRRKNDDEYIALTLAPDAQELRDATLLNLQRQMKPGGVLYHYDDIAARLIEQSLRIAGIFQVSGDTDSTVITKENLLSALNLTDWFVNHSITKIDSTRELSDEEKILFWLESHLVKNGSYDFSRNDIIKNGPLSTRLSERLMPALEKLESKRMVQLYNELGVNYVKFIGSKMEPAELVAKTNTPIHQAASLTLSKLARPE
ncbi:YfjI family protein [Yersinia ruckeri]|uniref:YfjI family protein n=1 Tax=Yersinia ruckeri TaxID=29486 RepID=UPI002237C264|nr:YfjI family protein [Yersinia ruckeri]MCW6567571.1 YfjI family protein [Yersinia ruckeri]